MKSLPGEAFECGTLRVYAERHATRLKLLGDEFMHFLCKAKNCSFYQSIRTFNTDLATQTFNLLHGRQFSLPQIVERLSGRRLKVSRVLSESPGSGVAAFAHAGMIPQSPFVQVWMRQGVNHRYSLVLRESLLSNLLVMKKRKKILTGSKTSIWHNKWTASWVACELRVYRAERDGGFGARRSMWLRAPSQACRMSSIEGVPRSSVISSSCSEILVN